MSNIKLEQISDVYQDCTCDYDVILNDKLTLKQFIELVINERNNDWGVFTLYNNDKKFKYNCGKISKNVIFNDKELNSIIFDISANGGYSMMNYTIVL